MKQGDKVSFAEDGKTKHGAVFTVLGGRALVDVPGEGLYKKDANELVLEESAESAEEEEEDTDAEFIRQAVCLLNGITAGLEEGFDALESVLIYMAGAHREARLADGND